MSFFKKSYLAGLSAVVFCFGLSSLANAALIIDPTFDSSITTDPNAAEIEAGINAAIAEVESHIENPITVNITFTNMTSGLGGSSSFISTIRYSTYLSDLKNRQILSANDKTAIASLPTARNNPVNGSTNVTITTALSKALGGFSSGSDGSIGLNTSIMNLTQTGAQDPNFYDLVGVTIHEINEVLGIGGVGSTLPTTSGAIAPMDLFRYSAPGVRSFTTSSSATAYFSINGGTNNLVNFNQSGNGSDYGDWAVGNTPQVQDYATPPGINLSIGANELTALDVAGYNLLAVPEPAASALLGLGVFILLAAVRHRSSLHPIKLD